MIVYVADDESMMLEGELEVIKNVLPGARIRGFQEGRELLKAAQEKPCDIAFLDIHMMDISGIELAAALKEVNPSINIIFVTAYDAYYRDAMRLHASGYILKPVTEEDVREEIGDLRYSLEEKSGHHKPLLKVYCFGNFDVRDTSDVPLHFERTKAKEAFAYIVHMKGRPCTVRELTAALFEDEAFDKKQEKYIQKIISSMMKTLRNCQAEETIEKQFNSMAIRPEFIECDYYKWLEENPDKMYIIPDNYMRLYTWRFS